ncbi:MAG: hypothetical protein ABI467_10665 [Kofleriaceae bacterium]
MPIVGMAIAAMAITAGFVAGLAGLKMPKPRRRSYFAGGLGLGVLGAFLFVWSITLIGPS